MAGARVPGKTTSARLRIRRTADAARRDQATDGAAKRRAVPGKAGRQSPRRRCQADRPTRTEANAMQVRMKRGMGGPPAEKEVTGLTQPSVDVHLRES